MLRNVDMSMDLVKAIKANSSGDSGLIPSEIEEAAGTGMKKWHHL